jgi:hypothetical protein
MTRLRTCLPFLAGVLTVVASGAHAASDCQPIYDAYAAMAKAPAVKKTVKTPGMAEPVELIITSTALYSRVGAKDTWSKTPIDDQTRSIIKRGSPSPETVTDCRKVGARPLDGVAATAYEFSPAAITGNAPGEKLTVVIGDKSGLPLSETAAVAGTEARLVYDGVTVPAP